MDIREVYKIEAGKEHTLFTCPCVCSVFKTAAGQVRLNIQEEGRVVAAKAGDELVRYMADGKSCWKVVKMYEINS